MIIITMAITTGAKAAKKIQFKINIVVRKKLKNLNQRNE